MLAIFCRAVGNEMLADYFSTRKNVHIPLCYFTNGRYKNIDEGSLYLITAALA